MLYYMLDALAKHKRQQSRDELQEWAEPGQRSRQAEWRWPVAREQLLIVQ